MPGIESDHDQVPHRQQGDTGDAIDGDGDRPARVTRFVATCGRPAFRSGSFVECLQRPAPRITDLDESVSPWTSGEDVYP
jgi:hypothetical protein